MSDLAATLVAAALGCHAVGALLGLALGRRPRAAGMVGYGAAALGSALWTLVGVAALAGTPWRLTVPWLLPPPGVELASDPLAGLFLLLIGGVGVPASVYAIGYTGDAAHPATGPLLAYHAFLPAMGLVALAANVFTFLVAWEVMAVASYFLVIAETGDRQAVRAGWVYALVTHAGLACLIAGMLVLVSATGSERFADWSAAAAGLPVGTRNAAFLLFVLGFGSKAGLVPLHVWLPLAHPVAPSHASALMSGVMIKLGVLGLLRAGLDWLGAGPPWWGVVLLVLGAASALLGILYALVESDLKRVLAYSSVENVGLIVLGVGAALLFRATGAETLARLGAAAALYHTVSHASIKGLLFLGAGAVVRAVGGGSMEALGGLIKRMPHTAAGFLVGALGIAAMPPLSGFVSEWLLFQALLQSTQVQRPGLNLVLLLALGALALTAGLAVACFVRAFGITFLALPRSDAAATAVEAPPSMRVAVYALAVPCVLLGVLAPLVAPGLAGLAPGLGAGGAPPALVVDGVSIAVGAGFSRVSPPTVAVLLVLALGAVLLLLRLAGARRDRRAYETWGCGRSLQTARMEYTAAAYSQPFKRIFALVYRPVQRLDIEHHPESRFFVRTIRYGNVPRPLVEGWLYLPALTAARWVARLAPRIQSGSANLYLAYILVVLLVCLLVAVR